MNSQHKVLCTHCGKLIPVAESDAHCATHEKTPIPAVASERERVAIELERICCAWDDHLGECTKQTILKAADLLQRAQADALDARRYWWLIENSNIETIENESGVGFWWKANANPSNNPDWNTPEKFAARIDAALRTSSPDPVVPRGEDGEKGNG